MKPTIHINSFVRRQTAESRFSFFAGSDDQLLYRLNEAFEQGRKGYTDGVWIVPVEAHRFFSGVIKLKEGDALVGAFEPRTKGEEPRQAVWSPRRVKLPAQTVEIILYASTLLAVDGDNEMDPEEGNWEVISINAFPTEEGEPPIHHETLMHNHFGSDGGTDTGMTPEAFEAALRESFEYWKDKAMCG
jgi:hypothetical protein